MLLYHYIQELQIGRMQSMLEMTSQHLGINGHQRAYSSSPLFCPSSAGALFSCSELQQLLGQSHSLQGSSASDGCAQLHRRRVSSLFQNLRALFPCSYLVRFSSESHGSDQNILPTLSAFSLLDKCHVQSYLENLLGCI